jgi:hypothetical protein
MTRRIAASATDTIQVSEADLERIAAEERLHEEHRSRAAVVIASTARDSEDCRLLLDILGIDHSTVAAALHRVQSPHAGRTATKREAKAAKPKTAARRRSAA